MKRLHLSTKKLVVIVVGVLLILGIGLAFDLHFHGIVWNVFYRTTGEETPLAQITGFIQYIGNITRRQPVVNGSSSPDWTAYTGGNTFGVNTFLENEVEVAKRERQVQLIADAGIGWIRQQFAWEDIEISARGNFTDSRNGVAVSAWDKYDNIVDLAGKYHLQIIARLGKPPAWSEPSGALQGYTPPTDTQDFVNYATTLASRYKGKIHVYQVWNEPNIYPEWGNQDVSPEQYTALLCGTYSALKAVDPSIVVMSATLAQTVELSGVNLNDVVYLQRMYTAGAGKCFDILGAQGYGLFSGPTDQRMRPTSINFAHLLWLRDMMMANNDGAKPIWVGEMAWNPVPDAATAPDIQDRLRYGQVSEDEAARYAVGAYQRAKAEWPFVGVICYYYFKRADNSEVSQSWYYFRMADPDFTLRPVYNAIKAYATQNQTQGQVPN